MSAGFAEKVAAWTREAQRAIEVVFVESTVEVTDFMQIIGISTAYPSGQGGYLPVDTGWLMHSIQVSLSAMPMINPDSYPPEGAQPGAGLHLIKWDSEVTYAEIRSAKIGETIFIGYTAAYSAWQEYASPTIKGFVRKAAQRWPSIVEAVAQKYSSDASSLQLTAHR